MQSKRMMKMKTKIERGCTRIHSGVERLGLRIDWKEKESEKVYIQKNSIG
jgi:hypothetical protein